MQEREAAWKKEEEKRMMKSAREDVCGCHEELLAVCLFRAFVPSLFVYL